ncbi:hypothetical protein SRHO_G00018140 [Serrasalmus rhombeus]
MQHGVQANLHGDSAGPLMPSHFTPRHRSVCLPAQTNLAVEVQVRWDDADLRFDISQGRAAWGATGSRLQLQKRTT